jgi:hypothetical protein
MVVVAIVLKPLIECTYVLEGDSCCSVITYDYIMEIKNQFDMYGHTMGYPGFEDEVNHLLIEYARKRQVILLNNEALLNNYKAHALYLIHHAVEYFKDTILLKLSRDLEIS